MTPSPGTVRWRDGQVVVIAIAVADGGVLRYAAQSDGTPVNFRESGWTSNTRAKIWSPA